MGESAALDVLGDGEETTDGKGQGVFVRLLVVFQVVAQPDIMCCDEEGCQ